MIRDTGLPAISGHPHPEASRHLGDALRRAAQNSALADGAARCADAARTRGEPIAASAVPYRRYLLLEAPGPWGSALDERSLDARLAPLLDRANAAAGLNVLLIRRPGRHHPAAAENGSRAWALADTSTQGERVLWGSWSAPDDLLGLDLTAPLPATTARSGPQRVALTCTNGKRDLCCAVRGRPVADALATVDGWDCWESSHLGGHRFAATVMLLPTGDMFGWLNPRTAAMTVARFDAGQFLLPYYRGRSGLPFPVQAALHAARVRLGDSRRHALTVTAATRLPATAGITGASLATRATRGTKAATATAGPATAGATAETADGTAGPETRSPTGSQAPTDLWEVLVSHQADVTTAAAVTYRVTVAGATPAPALLSCGDDRPQAEVRYTAIAFSRAQR